MISIIIPAYNRGHIIGNTLKSIADQSYKDFEVIIVNDGSTDNIRDTVSAVCSDWKQEVVFIDQARQGAPVARNKGFKYSKGNYIFFCDSDITLKKTCLEKMKLTLDNNVRKSYAYCQFKLGFKTFSSFDFDANKLKQFNYISMMSLMRREHFSNFDENLKKFQDWDLWLTLLEQGHTGILLKEVLWTTTIWSSGGCSVWLPKIFYKIPWKKFGIKIAPLEEYEYWKAIIYQKHNIKN